MAGLRTVLRLLLLHHHRSKVPTGFLPLDRIESVAILRTPDEYAVDRMMKDFFTSRGIRVRLMSKKDKNLLSNEDLFICLLAEPDIDELYAAVCSKAKFKIGTHNLVKDVYNIVVTVTKDSDARQVAIFETIADLLEKIR